MNTEQTSKNIFKNVQDCLEAVASCSKEQKILKTALKIKEQMKKKLIKEKERGNHFLIRIHCNHLVAVSASVLIKLVRRKEKLYTNNTM